MVFITGDTHGFYDFFKLEVFAEERKDLGYDDYVIIAGDFGGVWSRRSLKNDLKPYEELPFTVLFIDGNHENFEILENDYPVEIWNGGKVHRIADNIIHLMRGQVFYIEKKTFFTFGGATSIDRAFRTENVGWWKREVPSDEDMKEANVNLEKVGFKVDFIVTHSCDERALYYPPLISSDFQKGVFPENVMLSYFEETVDYGHWFFGHYHLDGDFNDKKTVLYGDIIRII